MSSGVNVTENNAESQKPNDGFEEALEKIGGHTCWTWKIYFATSLSLVFEVWMFTCWLFLAQKIDFRCRLDDLEAAGWDEQQQRNLTGTLDTKDMCEVPDLDYQRLAKLSFDDAWKQSQKELKTAGSIKCTKFIFKETGTSIMADFDLVCDRLVYLAHQQMIVGIGMVIGSVLFGMVSDNFGRRTAFIAATVLLFVTGPIPSFVPNYWVLFISRLCAGISGMGTFYSGAALLFECIQISKRGLFIILYNMPWAVGLLLLALIAYFVRPWRSLQACLSFPVALLFISCAIIPESPRWLVTQNRRSEAWKIIMNADKTLAPTQEIPDQKIVNRTCRQKMDDLDGRMRTVFSVRELVLRLVICTLLWIFTTLSYYVLSINAVNFGTNIYVYCAVSGVIEAVCYVLPVIILRFVGRRLSCVIFYTVGGTALVLIIVVPENELIAIAILAMIGRLCNGAVSTILILITGELFPTVTRNISIGICSALARVGSIGAPYIVVNAGSFDKSIPGLVCGAAAIVCVFLVVLLPETRGRPLRDTVEEVKEDEKEGYKVDVKNICSFK